MARAPSTETQLKTAKRELAAMTTQRDNWRREANSAMKRLEQAIAERDEWKSRFDKLLDKAGPMKAQSEWQS